MATQHLTVGIASLQAQPAQAGAITDLEVLPGRPEPLGASIDAVQVRWNPAHDDSVVLAWLSRFSAGRRQLCAQLFWGVGSDAVPVQPDDLRMGRVSREVMLDSQKNRTGSVWHALICNLDQALLYGELLIVSGHPASG